MRQLELVARGEPSDVIELNTVFEPVLGQEEVLVSMEAAPLKVDVALQGKRVLILPTYDHITGQPARIAVPVLIDVPTAYLIGAMRKCETYAERQQ